MSRFNPAGETGQSLRLVDELAALDSPMHRLAPLPKLLLTVLYVALTLSFPKYALSGLSVMALFPAFGYQLAGISLWVCFRRLRFILPLVCAVGLMTEAYSLRAPGQRGVHISAWGSFLGQLLLRSMDRAESLYSSMLLRGFTGELPGSFNSAVSPLSWTAAGICAALMVLSRMYDLPALLGKLFIGG